MREELSIQVNNYYFSVPNDQWYTEDNFLTLYFYTTEDIPNNVCKVWSKSMGLNLYNLVKIKNGKFHTKKQFISHEYKLTKLHG